MGYRRVLVGTDGGSTATEAVEHAARMAAATGAELVVATAYLTESAKAKELEIADEHAPADVRWAVTGATEAEETVARAREVAFAAAGAARLEVRGICLPGDPATALLSLADELSCDLVVVGNRGMAGTNRFVLGSIPNRVSHRARCDVLIVNTVHRGAPA